MGFANPIIGGMAALIRQAIRSPNFVAGLSGWSINKDGSVEFNNGTFRGTISAATIDGGVVVGALIETAAGNPSIQLDSLRNTFFIYDSDNHLVATASQSSGQDFFNNTWLAGYTIYTAGFPATPPFFAVRLNPVTAAIDWLTTNDLMGSWTPIGSITPDGNGNLIAAPLVAVNPVSGGAEIWHPMSPLQNVWTASSPAPQYRLNVLGKVEVQGFITHASFTGSSQIFTLPAGYRPSAVLRKPIFPGFPATTGTYYLSLDASGNLVINASGGSNIIEAQFDTSFTIS